MSAQAKITDFFASPSNPKTTSIKSLPKKLPYPNESQDDVIVIGSDDTVARSNAKSDPAVPSPVVISDDDSTDVDERYAVSGDDHIESKIVADRLSDKTEKNKNISLNDDSVPNRTAKSLGDHTRRKKYSATSDTKTPQTKRPKLRVKNNENSGSDGDNVTLEDGIIGMKVRSPNG